MRDLIIPRLLKSVSVQFQGSLVAMKFTRAVVLPHPPIKRSVILSFSARSRLRLIKLMHMTDVKSHQWSFVTLTYGKDFPDAKTSKRHLRAFLKRLYRSKYFNGQKPAILWRLEFQKRGAPHYHLMIPDCPFLPFKWLKWLWNEVIEGNSARVNIKRCSDRMGAMRYVAKYMCKLENTGSNPLSSSFFISVPYQADSPPGRFWGIENKASFPFADCEWLELYDHYQAATELKRYARRYFRGINKKGSCGFVLLVNNSERWLELWEWIRIKHDRMGAMGIVMSQETIKHRPG